MTDDMPIIEDKKILKLYKWGQLFLKNHLLQQQFFTIFVVVCLSPA